MTNKHILLTLVLFTLSFFVSKSQTSLTSNLEKHVYTLASDSLQGRAAGTIHAQKAANYIINEWTDSDTDIHPDTTFMYSFGENDKYQNIVKIITGNDEKLKNEYIVIGAHYDHLGVKKGEIYNGADDNASGVATLIELGKALKKNQSNLKRSVMLVAFDAEEIGLVGSKHFINHTSATDMDIKLMFSIDMVGWYKASGAVNYAGTGTIKNGKELLKNPNLIPAGLNVSVKNFERSIFTATDTQPFAIKGVPTLAVTTGTKSPYHKPEDDAHLIDYEGMTLITEHLINLIGHIANDTEFNASGKIAKKHRENQLFTFGITGNLGTNYHHYTAGATDGKTASSSGIGLMSQVNFGRFAIRPEMYYEILNAKHPNGDISTNNLTVPISLVMQNMEGGAGVDVFLGGYYSYRFNGKQNGEKIDFVNTFNRNETGLTFGFGFQVKPFKIGFTSRQALTNFTQSPNSDNAHIRNRANYFTVSYVF